MSREVTPGNGPPNIHAMMGYQDMTPMQMNGGGGPMNGNMFGNSSTTSNNRKNDYVDSGVGEYLSYLDRWFSARVAIQCFKIDDTK